MATDLTPTARAVGEAINGRRADPFASRPHEQRMRLGLDNARWYAELALRNGATHEQVKHSAELAIERVGLDRIRPTGGATA